MKLTLSTALAFAVLTSLLPGCNRTANDRQDAARGAEVADQGPSAVRLVLEALRLSLRDPEGGARDDGPDRPGGAGGFLAVEAMARAQLGDRSADLVAHRAAEAATVEKACHGGILIGTRPRLDFEDDTSPIPRFPASGNCACAGMAGNASDHGRDGLSCGLRRR